MNTHLGRYYNNSELRLEFTCVKDINMKYLLKGPVDFASSAIETNSATILQRG